MTTATYNCKALYDVKVRTAPNTANTSTEKFLAGDTFQISEIVSDSLDPTNMAKKWGHIFGGKFDGKYTALEYPSNPVPISSYTPIVTDPPPDTTPTFPESFTLVDPQGNKAEYAFVRIVE